MFTYKAIELYPKRNGDKGEKLYLTDYATRNISKFFLYCRENHITGKIFTEKFGLTWKYLYEHWNGYTAPKLGLYLRMMKFAHIENRRQDINYAYAQVIYPPEEIERRLLRIGLERRKTQHGRIDINPILEGIGGRYERVVVRDSLTYGLRRSLLCYGKIMFWLMAQERRLKLPGRVYFKQ